MRPLMLILLLLPERAIAVGWPADSAAAPRPRSFTMLAGVGNTMGWLGLQGEKYFRRERVSVFGGLGYTIEVDAGDATGVTVAAGARAYTPGIKHRGFLELSLSQLWVGTSCFDDCRRHYGPGLQAGYQFATRGGFTLMASFGVGYAPGVPDDQAEVAAMGGLGLGYTWRH